MTSPRNRTKSYSSLSISLGASLPEPPEPDAMVMEMDMEMEMESPDVPREHTASRLPTYRHVDLLQKRALALAPVSLRTDGVNLECPSESQDEGTTTKLANNPQTQHRHNQSTTSSSSREKIHFERNSSASLNSPQQSSHHLSFPTDTTTTTTTTATISHTTSATPNSAHLHLYPQSPRPVDVSESPAAKQPKATRRVHPATVTTSRNNKHNGPPLSMITQGFYDSHVREADSTTNWVAQQSMSLTTTSTDQPPSPTQQQSSSPSGTDTPSARPLIKPIRGFKPSSRKSIEMNSRRASRDPDDTLRASDGFDESRSHRNSNSQKQQTEQDEQTASDESDLFLRAAREEEKSARQSTNNSNTNSPSRSDSRRSRAVQRSSRPPSTVVIHPSIARRRGSDQESSNGVRPMDEQESVAQALTYRPTAKDRPTATEDINRIRYSNNSRSNPTTPRTLSSREISPESQVSYGPRRPSAPDATLPPRTSYRQSNLSYTAPRTYNSSPLISRSTEMQEAPETPRAAEGTESSVSTTAPSTVWDELEDLKSRIHRLELTGKMPPTAGAAMSRASNDRPPTATTTVTTLSSSPKRGRGNSISQEERVSTEPPPVKTHPLLRAALAKTKPVLGLEIYKALEAAASDALAIASMMGSSGQPGPISSSQSTVGGPTVSDRQVRRKADSMCRSLTELCLALSEAKPENTATAPNPVSNPPLVRASNHDPNEVRLSIEPAANQRQLMATAKSSPRALSRLEARRSSLLATSILPSPRYVPSELGTPTQTGRRTSLFLRTQRARTEEPEEEDATRFRTPSRAITEVGRLRQSPREYTSQQPLPERSLPVQSSLPVRRHYASTSLTNTVPPPMPPVSSLGGRRYLERSTPERDTPSVVTRVTESRLAEDRGQRKSSISQGYGLGRTGSLTRKTRQPPESPSAGHAGN